MNAAARTEARSPPALPCTSSVVDTATPTKPVKMFRTVTSRFWMNVGWFSAGGPHPGAPSGAALSFDRAARHRSRLAGRRQLSDARLADQPDAVDDQYRADEQQHDAEQHVLLLPGRSMTEHPRRAGLMPVRQRPPGLARHDVGLVGALLLAVQDAPERLGEERQARRSEDPLGVGPAAGAGGRSRRLRAAARYVESPAGVAGERVDRHAGA